MKLGFPLVLTSRATLTPGVDGYIAFDAAQLQTPNREAFALDEIRFHADCGLGTLADDQLPPSNYGDISVAPIPADDAGLFLEIKLRMGPYSICEAIPMWALSSVRDLVLEGASWRFPLAKSMFIPSGSGVVAQARLATRTVGGVVRYPSFAYTQTNINLSASLVGRVVTADFPRTSTVPYISAYKPNAKAQGQSFLSLETDLHNPLSKDLDLRYGLGRMGLLRSFLGGGLAEAAYSGDCADVRMACNCRMALGNRPIIAHQSEFNVSFDPCSRVLNLGGLTLGSGERLTFQADAPVYAPLTADAWAPVVSFVSDRKENV
ncbi:MAG: hypothetical protein KJ648_07270 [Candidatus Omnitrophica bacterium]|nr:hypothetical protein [Candidatus Omnitrophota bacterium]